MKKLSVPDHLFLLKIYFVFGVCLILISNSLSAQIRRDGVWCFGNQAKIDFNQTPPQCGTSAVHSRGTSASITDSSGNLLFYCQSGYLAYQMVTADHRGVVFNRNGQVMDNGDSLIATLLYHEMVIIPDPANNNTYYILHTAVNGQFGKIYYSKVDLNLNNGLGRVTHKNQLVDNVNFQYAADGLTAMKHGNGRDYWVLCHLATPGSYNNNFRKILITPNGIQTFQQDIGPATRDNIVRMIFNLTGDKFILYSHFGLLASFHFDRCTGIISEPRIIHSESNFTTRLESFLAAAYSPNDSLLYLAGDPTTFFLYQIDLSANDPYAGRILLDLDTINFAGCGFMKLSPDGKIYLTRGWQGYFPYTNTVIYNLALSVIENPNQPGFACNYQSLAFSLGSGRSYVGLQNSPNFDMPAAGGTICDTLGIWNGIDEAKNNTLLFYPNPSGGSLNFTSDALKQFETISLSDIHGRIVYEHRLTSQINLPHIEEGMYLMLVKSKTGKSEIHKVVIAH